MLLQQEFGVLEVAGSLTPVGIQKLTFQKWHEVKLMHNFWSMP